MCIYINLRKHSANCGGGARADAHINTNTHTHTHTHTHTSSNLGKHPCSSSGSGAHSKHLEVMRTEALEERLDPRERQLAASICTLLLVKQVKKPSRSGWIHASASSLPPLLLLVSMRTWVPGMQVNFLLVESPAGFRRRTL